MHAASMRRHACQKSLLPYVVQTIAERERIEAEEEERYKREQERKKERKVRQPQQGRPTSVLWLRLRPRSWPSLCFLHAVHASQHAFCQQCYGPCLVLWLLHICMTHCSYLLTQKETRELVIQRLEQERAEAEAANAGPVGIDDIDTEDEVCHLHAQSSPLPFFGCRLGELMVACCPSTVRLRLDCIQCEKYVE